MTTHSDHQVPFEVWAIEEHVDISLNRQRNCDMLYAFPSTETAWKAWCVSASINAASTHTPPAEVGQAVAYPAVFTSTLNGKPVCLHGSVESVKALFDYTEPTANSAEGKVVPDDCGKIERALAELVDKIVPGLETGDLLKDALTASHALDKLVTFVENVASPMSEPLNSAVGCATKDQRRYWMGVLRASAREAMLNATASTSKGICASCGKSNKWDPESGICRECQDV